MLIVMKTQIIKNVKLHVEVKDKKQIKNIDNIRKKQLES